MSQWIQLRADWPGHWDLMRVDDTWGALHLQLSFPLAHPPEHSTAAWATGKRAGISGEGWWHSDLLSRALVRGPQGFPTHQDNCKDAFVVSILSPTNSPGAWAGGLTEFRSFKLCFSYIFLKLLASMTLTCWQEFAGKAKEWGVIKEILDSSWLSRPWLLAFLRIAISQ